MEQAKIFDPGQEINYTEGGIVSKQIIKDKGGNVTLFAFDQGQQLSEHTAPFDALIHLVDGEAEIAIDKKKYQVFKGSAIILPANVPHAVQATTRFKMLLTMIKA